jgi:hypothetical protein
MGREARSAKCAAGRAGESSDRAQHMLNTSGSASTPVKLREERLAEEDPRKKIMPLKNGGQIEARTGMAYFDCFCDIQAQEPDDLRALLSLAQGQCEEVPAAVIDGLRDTGFLEADGSLKPGPRDVLLSAYRETPDGPVLVMPFVLKDEEAARVFERMEQQGIERLIRRLRRDRDKDEGRPGGRG